MLMLASCVSCTLFEIARAACLRLHLEYRFREHRDNHFVYVSSQLVEEAIVVQGLSPCNDVVGVVIVGGANINPSLGLNVANAAVVGSHSTLHLLVARPVGVLGSHVADALGKDAGACKQA